MPSINSIEARRQMTARLYFTPTGTTDPVNLGDVSSWKPSHEIKRTPIMDSAKGFRQKTRELLTEYGWQYDITLGEMTNEVLELCCLGTLGADVVQALITAPTGTASFSGVKLRRGYNLGKESVDTVVVKNASNTVTYVLDTDYVLDADAGIIELKSGGAITEGSTINVTFGCASKTRTPITALNKIYASGSFKLLAFDQHDNRPIETHTFTGQCYISDFGSSDGSKIMEVQLRVIASAAPVISVRK